VDGPLNAQASTLAAAETKVGPYDTTLRDGERSLGVVMTPEQKLEIARLLDELGLNVPGTRRPDPLAVVKQSAIEKGRPVSGVEFRALAELATTAKQ